MLTFSQIRDIPFSIIQSIYQILEPPGWLFLIMPIKFSISSGALSLALLLFGHDNLAKATKDTDTSYIHFDSIEYIANASNTIPMSWSALKTAFADPVSEDIATYTALDWTKPYPGSPLPGFTAHLRVTDRVPFPPAVAEKLDGSGTEVAAINYGIPPSMRKADGLPKKMHPSWNICQHYYVSTEPDPSSPVSHDCSFLPSECQKDLKYDMTKDWGAFKDEEGAHGLMCSGWAFDAIPLSCENSLGFVTADVYGK